MNRKIKEFIGINILRLMIVISMGFLFLFLAMIFSKGFSVLNWQFLSQFPKNGMTEGGIFPAIIGTLYLTILSVAIAFPIGLMSAIYMAEYGKPEFLMTLVRSAINTLSGVPSIVFGLFGLAIFVNLFNLDVSLVSGALTLSIVILPLMINSAEESLKQVPYSFREASYALGATKSQTIIKVVIPAAFPNILTGVIISIGRVAGETAPILFTAVTFFTRKLPKGLGDEVMALPYHIYALMTEGTMPEKQVPIAYGTAIVLLLLVLSVNGIAIIVRYRLRRSKKW